MAFRCARRELGSIIAGVSLFAAAGLVGGSAPAGAHSRAGQGPEPDSIALTVAISFPGANARFKHGLNVIVKGTVSGAIVPIPVTTVSIYVDNVLKGTTDTNDDDGNWKYTETGPPWGWQTSGSARGNHVIKAEINDGGQLRSDTVTVNLFKMIWPVGGRGNVNQGFGGDHKGIDIGCPAGAVIRAAEDGNEGHTGNSSWAHLHFEVRESDTPVDPLGWLP